MCASYPMTFLVRKILNQTTPSRSLLTGLLIGALKKTQLELKEKLISPINEALEGYADTTSISCSKSNPACDQALHYFLEHQLKSIDLYPLDSGSHGYSPYDLNSLLKRIISGPYYEGSGREGKITSSNSISAFIVPHEECYNELRLIFDEFRDGTAMNENLGLALATKN